MEKIDYIAIAPRVGEHLLGPTTKKTDTEWRWGTHGSWCLNLENGLFHTFEHNEGGGLLWFIEYLGQDKNDILSLFTSNTMKPKKKYQKFTPFEMRDLAKQAIVTCKYSDRFVVMRFPEGHKIKQKYAPFSLENGSWLLKRPEGKMPIYLSEGSDEEQIIINEGEKAAKGCEKLYKGISCCWHGGVNGWNSSDWSPIFGRNITIWPDNDEPGKKVAQELADYLIKNKCNVKIAKIPDNFKEKDDLYDAYANQLLDSQGLYDHINNNYIKASRKGLTLRRVKDLITDIREPEWIIEDVCEKDSVIDIYGAPKTGKSFVAVDMALSVSLGLKWHNFNTEQHPVIYLAGEGQRGIARRISAWQQFYGHDVFKSELFVSDRGIRFLDQKDHQELIEHISDVQDEMGDIGFIVIDTLARNFGAGNENSTEDMNLFIERVDALKNIFGCCIALIHHTGHMSSGRARGSSVLPAAVDAEFSVKRKDENDQMIVEFAQTLVKDGKNIKPMYFAFKEVELMQYPGMTSGILEYTERTELIVDDSKALTETQEKIKELQESMANGMDMDPISIWIKHSDIVRALPDIDENTIKQRLKRLRDTDKIHWERGKGYQSKSFDEIK